MITLVAVFIILLVISGGTGYYGNTAGWGYVGWSPFGIVLIILLFLLLSGRIS